MTRGVAWASNRRDGAGGLVEKDAFAADKAGPFPGGAGVEGALTVAAAVGAVVHGGEGEGIDPKRKKFFEEHLKKWTFSLSFSG